MKFAIMRRPCLMEDEGRHFLVSVVDSEEEAWKWINRQEGEYFGPMDYYVLKESKEAGDDRFRAS